MNKEKVEKARIKNVYNRLGMIMAHTNRYAFDPAPRLARDTGLSYTTIYNILHGYNSPTYWTAIRITEALEKATGKRLDPREIMDINKKFPTESGCHFMGCSHCEYSDYNTTVVSTVEAPGRCKD
jgi:DNA-binding XRE family transcriptional regulator